MFIQYRDLPKYKEALREARMIARHCPGTQIIKLPGRGVRLISHKGGDKLLITVSMLLDIWQ